MKPDAAVGGGVGARGALGADAIAGAAVTTCGAIVGGSVAGASVTGGGVGSEGVTAAAGASGLVGGAVAVGELTDLFVDAAGTLDDGDAERATLGDDAGGSAGTDPGVVGVPLHAAARSATTMGAATRSGDIPPRGGG